MTLRQPLFWSLAIALSTTLAACGGGNNDAQISGNVSGLATGTTLVVQDNGGDNLTLTANGGFGFATRLSANTSYAVTVLTQPTGQACAVESGSGSTDSNADSVNSVSVTCLSMATVGGNVAGLLPGTAVTLSNGDVLLPVAVNGSFSIPGLLTAGTPYTITVATQPVGETCTVLNGTGTVAAGVAVNVTVACSA